MSLLPSHHESRPIRAPVSAAATLLAQAGLSPPPLLHQTAVTPHESDSNLVLRSLYPSPQPARALQGNFADEQVYRSVVMDMPSEAAEDEAESYPQPIKGLSMLALSHSQGKGASMPPVYSHHPFHHESFLPHHHKMDFTKQPFQMPFQKSHLQEFLEQQEKAAAVPINRAAAVPPSMPHWIEPRSHFFVEIVPPTTVTMLYESILAALQSLDECEPSSLESTSDSSSTESASARVICTLDCQPTPERFKFSCTAYQSCSGHATPFIVRMFSAKEANKFCVEFQRRQGDVIHFYELYRTARARIETMYPPSAGSAELNHKMPQRSASAAASSGGSDPLAPPRSLRSWSAPPLPTEEGHSFSKDHICETVRSLLQMCSSPCIDIKLQGVLSLADLSCSPSFEDAVKRCNFNLHEVLVAEGCTELFLSCLPMEHVELHRASMTALANLSATQERICSDIVGNEKNLECLYKLCQSSTHQVARECARFLANCAKSLGQRMFDHLPHNHKPTFRQVVSQLMCHSDAHCRKHACDINSRACAWEGKNQVVAH